MAPILAPIGEPLAVVPVARLSSRSPVNERQGRGGGVNERQGRGGGVNERQGEAQQPLACDHG